MEIKVYFDTLGRSNMIKTRSQNFKIFKTNFLYFLKTYFLDV